ncbi:unnamed protein product [Calypogeia fissa]
MKWERVEVKYRARETPEKTPKARRGGAHGPGRKWGHTCNAVKKGRLLYVFGGYGRDDCQTNDVHVFDTTKQMWSKPMVKGTPPSPRDSHTCTTVGNRLFVFGGTDGSSPLKDLHILDTDSNSWSSPIPRGEGPAAREGHSAALIGHRLFVFGGCGRSPDDMEETYFNDLYILDTSTLIWTKAATRGPAPAPRDSHTCSSYRNKFIVLGGEDSSNSYLSDIYILDADTLQWSELRTTGQKLIPRAGHTTVALGKYLFVFGGFTDDRKLFDDLHVLNVENGVWTKATTVGEGPSPRFSLAGDCAEPDKGILMFIGGCNENLEALDDMYYLDTELKAEKTDAEQKPEKLSLKKELKRKQQELLLTPEKGKENTTIALDDNFRSSVNNSPLVAGAHKYSFHEYKPVLERNIEAKVTDVFHYGYSVEATIDGKVLRGLLFSYTPGYSNAVQAHLMRKRKIDEDAAAKIKEARRAERRVARQAKALMKQAAEAQAAVAVKPPNAGIAAPQPVATSGAVQVNCPVKLLQGPVTESS